MDIDELFVVPDADVGQDEVAQPVADTVDVAALIPSTVLQQSSNPNLPAAVFGYDIQQMKERPWAQPGANRSDYFNYGFDEKKWRIYCAMQAEGEAALVKRATAFYETIEGTVLRSQGGGSAAPLAVQVGGPSASVHSGRGGAGGMDMTTPPNMEMAPTRSGAAGGAGGGGGSAFFKTRLCQRYQEGRCNRGDSCNYAHGTHELRSNPSSGQPQQAMYGGNMMMGTYGGGAMMPPMGGAVPPYDPSSQQQGFRPMPQKRARSNERPEDSVFEGYN